MRIAVLGNGPSRVAFKSDLGYNYTIGCNVPWTHVDFTVILDKEILERVAPTHRFYCSRDAWRELHKKENYIAFLIELFDKIPEYDSSGHAATRIAIKLGAKEIDIYGCDSWWENNTESYTHKYVDGRCEDMTKNVSAWRVNWYKLMSSHPDVKINFIGEPK